MNVRVPCQRKSSDVLAVIEVQHRYCFAARILRFSRLRRFDLLCSFMQVSVVVSVERETVMYDLATSLCSLGCFVQAPS